jgi:adenylate cyclase
MSQSRQLAAIMFTDIAGYTALMGDDEQKAFELLRKNRQIQRPLIDQFGGKWIKELGDGVLASFATASDAVNCAVSIQEACKKETDLNLRIGIHLGEVVFEDDDVFGDSVNIASRLQSIAPVNSIIISESVYNNVANKKGMVVHYAGEQNLKNVREPIRIFQVYPVGEHAGFAHAGFAYKAPDKKASAKSIAVLPFVNMSNDPEQEYFSDGMAEEILNSLVHLKDLKVAGRTSSFQFKGKNIDLREVGEKLGVTTVLEGSVRKQGNRLRVTAQLINVADGFHFWSEKYDRDMDDIFAIQDEIALAITEQLKITLLDKDRELVTKTATLNTEAYELYLKGMFHINRRGSSILTGLECFRQAIAIDPEYSLAYTGYADANFLGSFYSFFPGKAVMEKVKDAVEKAIKLDDTRPESYCTKAQYYLGLEWNWQEAENNYLKSLELNPRFAQTHSLYGMAHLAFIQQRYEEAEKQGRIAIKLEPLSAIDHADFSWTLYYARKFGEALTVAQTGIELDANSFLSQRLAGLCLMALKRYNEAVDTFNYLIQISNRHQHAVNSLIWVYCSMGNFAAAHVLMQELVDRSKTEYIAGTNFGLSAAWLGDVETALDYLEKAWREHDPVIITLNNAPNVPASLLQEPRYQKLIKRLHFPDKT